MLNLEKLTVSLTKHGAHKIALLLERYDKDNILSHLNGKVASINIDAAQAKKNLSVTSSGEVREVWNKARAAGKEAIRGLVLVGIIFSHHELIKAMQRGRVGSMRGQIKRDVILRGIAFTDFAHSLEELGYSVSHTPDYVTYDLSPLFKMPGMNELVLELAEVKFRGHVWNGKRPLIDELIDSKFHDVFALTEQQFRDWLRTGAWGSLRSTPKMKCSFLAIAATAV